MRALITIIPVILAFSTAVADVYKWVDEHGVVQYSDRPVEKDAQKVDLPPASLYQPPTYSPAAAPKDANAGAAAAAYAKVELAKPTPDETLRDNNGDVEVSVVLDPALMDGHTLSVVIDGRVAFEKITKTLMVINNVDRGTHQIQVRVMDGAGKQIAATPTVTFHLHRMIAPKPKTPTTPAPQGS